MVSQFRYIVDPNPTAAGPQYIFRFVGCARGRRRQSGSELVSKTHRSCFRQQLRNFPSLIIGGIFQLPPSGGVFQRQDRVVPSPPHARVIFQVSRPEIPQSRLASKSLFDSFVNLDAEDICWGVQGGPLGTPGRRSRVL